MFTICTIKCYIFFGYQTIPCVLTKRMYILSHALFQITESKLLKLLSKIILLHFKRIDNYYRFIIRMIRMESKKHVYWSKYWFFLQCLKSSAEFCEKWSFSKLLVCFQKFHQSCEKKLKINFIFNFDSQKRPRAYLDQ